MNQPKANSKTIKNDIDPRFIKSIDGKDFVLYNGLLNAAHENGLKSLEVDVLQFPTSENGNTIICHAKATDSEERVFSEIADANADNVDENMKPHYIRIAATRAKARVLRDFNNVTLTCLEELGKNVDPATTEPPPSSVVTKPKPEPPNKSSKQEPIQLPNQNQTPSNNSNTNQPVSKISPTQKNAIENLAQRSKMKDDELTKLAMDTYGCPVDELSSLDAANMIRLLQKSA